MKFCSINVNIFLARFVYCSMEKSFLGVAELLYYRFIPYRMVLHLTTRECFWDLCFNHPKEDLLYTNVSIIINEVFHFHFSFKNCCFREKALHKNSLLFQMNGWWFLSNTNWWHHVMIVWNLIYRNIYREEVPFL